MKPGSLNILITGGAGFIGSNLSRSLLKSGHRVTVIDNLVTGRKSNVADLAGNSNFTLSVGDISDKAALRQFSSPRAEPFDRIYHLACPTGVPNIERLGEEMLRACSYGTWNVLELAARHRARVLVVSSSEVYGDPEVFPQSESYAGNVHPHGWRANYEEGKRFTETLASWYGRSKGLDVRTVRLFNVYGPAMAWEDFRVIPRFVSQALSGDPLTIHGDGSQRRTFCYVSDLIAGLELILENGQSTEIYNLGGHEELSILDVAYLVLKLTNGGTIDKDRILFTARPSHDHGSRVPDLRKIHSLGWKQTLGFEEGLQKTITYFAKIEMSKSLPHVLSTHNKK